MSDEAFTIRIEDREIQRKLQEMQRRCINLRPAMMEIGEDQLRETDDRWEQEIDPDGVPWRPLSARTLSFKRQSSRLLKILMSTGRLRESINYFANDKSVVIGTNVSYAYKHQLGKDGNPQRKFLGVSEAGRLRILEILQTYINEA